MSTGREWRPNFQGGEGEGGAGGGEGSHMAQVDDNHLLPSLIGYSLFQLHQ